MRGDETPNTLANLVDALRQRHDSYLAQAVATDVDLYAATKDLPGKRLATPLHVEETPTVALLKVLVEQNQAIVHWLAVAAPKGARRPKPARLPRPKTAAQLWERQQVRQAHEHIESVLVRVPTDEFIRSTQTGQHAVDPVPLDAAPEIEGPGHDGG